MPVPAVDPTPGPGHYNVVDYDGPPKHYMSSSVFVSSTSRWSGDVLLNEENPGPGNKLVDTLMLRELQETKLKIDLWPKCSCVNFGSFCCV